MAEPDRPPGQRSLFAFGVSRVAEKRDMEAKRQARKQREQDAAATAAAAKRPVGRPEGSGKKPQQLVWVRIVCQRA